MVLDSRSSRRAQGGARGGSSLNPAQPAHATAPPRMVASTHAQDLVSSCHDGVWGYYGIGRHARTRTHTHNVLQHDVVLTMPCQ